MVIGYRIRIDRIFDCLRTFRRVPRPGWRVLLAGGGLSKWIRWAEKLERKTSRDPNAGDMQAGMREPWRFKSWNDFESWWQWGD